MNLNDAFKTISDNQNLIGRKDGENEITHLIVIPANNEKLTEIIMCLNFDQSYRHLLNGFIDFNVLALLDFDNYPNTGHLLYRRISKYL